MRIEFDPTNPDEATAVRAMLTAMHPEGAVISRTVSIVKREAPPFTLEEEFPLGSPFKGLEPRVTLSEGDTDTDGTPWDARIHSTPPTTNKDGTWRAKRGVKAEEIAAVKAEREAQAPTDPRELEALGVHPDDMSDPAYDAPVQEPSPTYAPESELPQAAQDAKVETVTAPPAPPAPTPLVETFAGGVAPSFLDVMKAITAAQKDGKIDTAKVKELCAAVGAGESTMGLNGPDNGDKRGAFMALLASETEGK